ncbi:MAG TPA: M14 metallopeptidase family protein [Candidatus Krumholzibacteriaceae bacterium]|nr:M14 metallopeptidase family protein [Candidatus Krumholzibacteriaceae bacterium]
MKRLLLIAFALIVVFTSAGRTADITSPEEYFGFSPGADRELIDYEDLIGYLQKLGSESPGLKLINIGLSPEGRDIYAAFISSPENIDNLKELEEINRELTLDPDIPEDKLEGMIERGKVFFAATLSMHSNEVGPSQSAPLIAHKLLGKEDERIDKWLKDVVYMMVPCHNPDGMDMVVDHYVKYRGTKYEGSSMPGIYHKYAGHDNNRDFVNLTQSDTRAISRIFSREWFPQVMVEKHQMGSGGVRYFIPPNHDPIAENIDAEVWNWCGLFGANMMKDMTNNGLAGVSQHYLFDDYWPGSTETCLWKNVIAFLTECASARHATPVYVEPDELKVHGKGLAEYKKSINMPLPWKGGWWRLSDIVQYEIVSTISVIKTCSYHRGDILRFRNDLCRKEVERGLTQPPYYYILPEQQHDSSSFVDLVNLMMRHGVEVHRLTSDVIINNRIYDSQSIVIKLSQPFRPFVKEVLERQHFPVRHYTPGGKMIRPYDVTSWSLPLLKGVEAFEIEERSVELEQQLVRVDEPFTLLKKRPSEFEAVILPASNNESYRAAFEACQSGLEVWRTEEKYENGQTEVSKGSYLIYNSNKKNEKLGGLLSSLKAEPVFADNIDGLKKRKLKLPRIALVETWFHDMDAGWTRFVFDSYNIHYKVIRPDDFKRIDLEDEFDIVIFPDRSSSILVDGRRKAGKREYLSGYPPEYTKGMGKEGKENLMLFLEAGGTVISWGRSASLFSGILKINKDDDKIEEFQLPVTDISDRLKKDDLYCPRSTVRILLADDHPLTYGMQEEIGVIFSGGPVFSTSIPRFDMDRAVIARFGEKDILMSGFCENEKLLAGKTAMVWVRKGKGQLVLFAFRPQFRASTDVSFKLLFNSLLLPDLE